MKIESSAIVSIIVVIVSILVVAWVFSMTTIKNDSYHQGYSEGRADTENKYYLSCQLPSYTCPASIDNPQE